MYNDPRAFPGATRVFEMQLMPALLLQLRVNELAERERAERQPTNGECCRPPGTNRNSTRARDEADSGEKGYGKSPSPAVVNSARGGDLLAIPRSSEGSSPKGVRRENGGGREAGASVRGHQDDEPGEEEEEAGHTPMPTPTAEERERVTTWGMDWGVVAVWSCPTSCDVSSEESVIVQRPV